MIRRPPISTRTDTLFPYTTLFRSDIAGGYAENGGYFFLHPGDVRIEFGLFETDSAVDIAGTVVVFPKELGGFFEQDHAVDAFPAGVGVGKMLTNVPQGRSEVSRVGKEGVSKGRSRWSP